MRDVIKQALKDLQNIYGDVVFTNPAQFKNSLGDVLGNRGVMASEAKRLRNLLNFAIIDMQSYSRLKTAFSKNEYYVINNLVSEMNKDYDVKTESAQIVMECIAELIGCDKNGEINLPQLNAILQRDHVDIEKKIEEIVVRNLEKLGLMIPSKPISAQSTKTTAIASLNSILKRGSKMQFGNFCWRVLDVQASKVLIITDNIIMQKPYDKSSNQWRTSKIREYLNGDFYDSNFIVDEKNAIQPNERLYNDKVFLLSRDEASRLFKDDVDRLATSAGKALKWYLRTDTTYNNVDVVDKKGDIAPDNGVWNIDRGYGIRPAMWVKL